MPTYEANLCLVNITLTHASGIQPCEVTFAVDNSANPTRTATAVADIVLDAFGDELKARIDNSVTIGPATVYQGDGTAFPEIGVSTLSNPAGTRSMNSLPPNICALVKKQTATTGRINRGRMFFPWMIDESALDESGHWPGDVAAVQTAMTAFLARLATDDEPMVIANRTYDVPWDSPNPRHLVAVSTGRPVTALTVDPLIASQRRRLGR